MLFYSEFDKVFNMASDWLEVVLPTNQKQYQKIAPKNYCLPPSYPVACVANNF